MVALAFTDACLLGNDVSTAVFVQPWYGKFSLEKPLNSSLLSTFPSKVAAQPTHHQNLLGAGKPAHCLLANAHWAPLYSALPASREQGWLCELLGCRYHLKCLREVNQDKNGC